MSDYQVSPNWWVASDGKWYPPEQHPNFAATAATSSADIWGDGTGGAQSSQSTAWDGPGTQRLPGASGASGASGPSGPRPQNGGIWTKKLPWLGVAFVGLSVMLLLFGISGSTRGEEAQIESTASDPTSRTESELGPDATNPRKSTTSSLPRQTTVPTSIPTTTIPVTTIPPTTAPPTTVAFTVPPEAIAAAAAAQAQAEAAKAARVAQEQAEAQARAAADAYVPPPAQSGSGSSSSGSSVYYSNCDAVRAAGAAPLLAGQPGYSFKLDRDRDGSACEP